MDTYTLDTYNEMAVDYFWTEDSEDSYGTETWTAVPEPEPYVPSQR